MNTAMIIALIQPHLNDPDIRERLKQVIKDRGASNLSMLEPTQELYDAFKAAIEVDK